MPSASSPVREALESYVAGRLKAERLVIAVTTAYYGGDKAGDGGRRKREELRPLIDVIDRASPGIVELGTVESSPGFTVRLAARPFPKQYEAELRHAAETYLETRQGGGKREERRVPAAAPGLVARVVAALRRLFTASA